MKNILFKLKKKQFNQSRPVQPNPEKKNRDKSKKNTFFLSSKNLK